MEKPSLLVFDVNETLIDFESSAQLDGAQLRLEPGQTVIPHGPDRDLALAEALPAEKRP